MTKKQARRIVWERLAATARNDADLGDWIIDNASTDADTKRLEEACADVSRIIESVHLRGPRP